MRSSAAGRWLVTVGFALFAVLTVTMLVLLLTGIEPPRGENLAGLLIVGGLAVAGIGALSQVWSAKSGRAGRLQWICIGVGLLLWAVAPVVALAGGLEWTTRLGSSARAPQLWFLAVLVWTAVAVAIGVGVAVLRRRRSKRRRPGRLR